MRPHQKLSNLAGNSKSVPATLAGRELPLTLEIYQNLTFKQRQETLDAWMFLLDIAAFPSYKNY